MRDGLELVLWRSADAPCRGLRRLQRRILLFESLKSPKQRVVLGVADLGTRLVIVEIGVARQLGAEPIYLSDDVVRDVGVGSRVGGGVGGLGLIGLEGGGGLGSGTGL